MPTSVTLVLALAVTFLSLGVQLSVAVPTPQTLIDTGPLPPVTNGILCPDGEYENPVGSGKCVSLSQPSSSSVGGSGGSSGDGG